jgi:hypothetical protein
MVPVSPSVIGKRFPEITGRSLAREEVTLPEDARGKVTLIVVAMERSAQPMVDSWVSPFREAFLGMDGYAWYEVPVIDRTIGLFLSGMIDAGMRAGIPPSEHGSVVTVYGNTRTVMKNLGISDRSTASAFLLDQDGIVCLTGEGHANAAEIEGMLSLARDLSRDPDRDHGGQRSLSHGERS